MNFKPLHNLKLITLILPDWDNDRPSNWKEGQNVRAVFGCWKRPTATATAWRYIVSQDLWYSRSVSNYPQSQSDWYPTGGLTGYARMNGNSGTHHTEHHKGGKH